MAARDLFHNAVKAALTKDGWQITDDPLVLKVGGVDLLIDLGAEKLLAAERDGQQIAVEIKSFVGTSAITDFHLAVGQFINYRTALKMKDPDRKLYLAIPEIAYETFFQKDFPRLVIQEYKLDLIIYDVANEEIIQWLP
ncbi:MAG: fatty-acid oxidation protein subunit alpha [Synechococcaceae cyanobacterium SM2_3_1]|nr:fatty-acid oxidation protein subunit alpha [Synechococcaceae cyanobacterium SM2_3_1]